MTPDWRDIGGEFWWAFWRGFWATLVWLAHLLVGYLGVAVLCGAGLDGAGYLDGLTPPPWLGEWGPYAMAGLALHYGLVLAAPVLLAGGLLRALLRPRPGGAAAAGPAAMAMDPAFRASLTARAAAAAEEAATRPAVLATDALTWLDPAQHELAGQVLLSVLPPPPPTPAPAPSGPARPPLRGWLTACPRCGRAPGLRADGTLADHTLPGPDRETFCPASRTAP